LKEFDAIFQAFNLLDWMFLRDKSIPKFRTAGEIQDRVNAMYMKQE